MKTNVNFLGHSISQDGLRPTAAKITDIVNFIEPKSVDQVRSFLGICSFYRKFIPKFAQEAEPLYSLLRKRSTFEWTEECRDAFKCIKNKLVEAELLHYPDFTKPFAVQSDAAKRGIGFVLMQEKDGEMVPIQYGGRTLTKTEVNYCTTDKELLAVFYSVKKCEVYVLGHAFLVYTDHKPLLYLQTFRDIVNKRFRWIQYLEEMNTKIRYICGKENIIADFISRNIADEKPWIVTYSNAFELSELLYSREEVMNKQMEDTELHFLYLYLTGKQDKESVHKSYRRFLNRISIDEGLLQYKHHNRYCVILPSELRQEIISACHADWATGHFGIYKSHQRILERYWWPTLFKDIKEFVENCSLCLRVKPQQKQQGRMGIRPWPSKPLHLISIDFLVNLPITSRGNRHLLVINDHFTKFIKLYPVKDRTAPTIAKCIVDFCLTFGIPYRLYSDMDPAFEAQLFQEIMKGLGIHKVRTCGYRPNANGLTEQSNNTIKQYLTKYIEENNQKQQNWDQWTRELSYAYNSSIHSSTGFSPAELMFGRKFRIPLDILHGSFLESSAYCSFEDYKKELNFMYNIAREKMDLRQAITVTYYDRKRQDSTLEIGDFVLPYNPRLKREKLTPKWTGPFEVIRCSHPMYQIKLTTEGKISEKWLPRDRLRKVSKNFELNIENNNEKFKETGPENRNMNNEFDYESDDDDTYNQDEPYRSKLRQNPARNTYYDGYVLNYIVSVL